MTTPYRLFLCAAGVVAAAGAGAFAADRTAPAATGHVLLLDNERTIEGDIARVGDEYRIRRATGETWVRHDKVLRLCADMDEAYRFLRGRANLSDPDELLRLARWCHGRNLSAQALECAAAAVNLVPKDVEARRLLSGLQRIAAEAPAQAAPHTAAAARPVEMPELNTAARAAFVTKIEPILMNACAGCHTTDRGGSFKLTRAYDAAAVHRLSVQQNLAAVLAQVNLRQPEASKLLLKAVTAHDPQAREAPLNKKQMAAYHTLEKWVQTTLANNPHLRDRTGPLPEVKAAPPQPAAPVPAPTAFAGERPAPAKPTTPVDDFDPVLFNRQSEPPAKK